MLEPIFSLSSYGATGLSIATAVTAVFALAVGTTVFIRSRWSSTASLFLLIELMVVAWLVASALTYAAQTPAVALFWARAGQLPLALLSAAVFHFAVANSRRQRPARAAKTTAWIGCCAVGLVAAATPLVIPGVAARPWGYHPIGGFGILAAGALTAIAYVGAMVILWHAFRRGEGRVRDRAGALFVALVLGTPGYIDVLPSIGIEVYPAGYIAAFAFATVAGAAMTQYALVDLTPQYAASQILETMKSAVLLVDMEGKIRVANRAAAALLGYEPPDLIGQDISGIIEPDHDTNRRGMLKSMGVIEQEMAWTTASGAPVDVLASSSFVRAADGAPVGVVYVASDYTERRRAELALRESEHRYRTLFDANPLPMWVFDFETLLFVAVNDAAVSHYGYSRDEFLQMKITDIRPPEDIPELMTLLPTLGARGRPTPFRHLKKDGTMIHTEVSSFDFSSKGSRMRLVIAHDVTERRRAEQLLRESEARYRLLFERNLAGVYRTSVDGSVLDCNDAFARMFGYDSREEMLRHSARSLYFDQADRERIISLLREHKTLTNLEARMRRRDDSPIWVLENMTLLEGETGEVGVLEGTVIDITDRKLAQEQVEYQAYHDVLTGLPNRLLFRDRLNLALAHARRSSQSAAVMYLDLDEFKSVNDKLGHTAGDRLLQAVAARLIAAVRAEDTVARMGGDEFTILLPDVGDGRGAATVARKILNTVAEAVFVDDHVLHVTPSIGVALFPGDGFDSETLLKNADRAMYRAKQLGRNNYQYATPPPFDDRFALQRRLADALGRGEFSLHYQPIVQIATGAVVAVEALVRWHDPERGLQQPDSFIHVAEEADLMPRIGEWILTTACQQLRQWREGGHPALRVAVNLSARQFAQRDLGAVVGRILDSTGLSADSLEIEISESTAMHNPEVSMQMMRRLKEMSVRIAIDDFGTGYSSFRYLKRLPIDKVKVDHEFVRNICLDPADRAAMSAVISMARALSVDVVAEGVETQEQLDFLRAEGCAEMQGFLHSRPMTPDELERTILANLGRPRSALLSDADA